MLNNFSKQVKISQAITSANGVAAQTAIKGVTLDMSGFEGVTALVSFGVITGGAVTSIKMQQSATTTDGDFTDLEGTSQTVVDTADDTLFYIDINNPTKRYVRVYVSRGTQNAVVAAATYFQYSGKFGPVTQATEVSGEFWQSPAEGTA